ncbi:MULTISPECIES: hypothetical protein [unclassified Bradyrhizobium]|uniref:hypothetical protein n=1 Tax=unclassified Bradyrhizobium TaxID=2631580 RepID=UPI0028E72419|nr:MULTISPECIES: hypothetical protein [unclassified Bradyrhizobium]
MTQYPIGIDCVWIASDRDGHVGAFISAGAGPIPAAGFDSDQIPIEDIETRLCQLPIVSSAHLLATVRSPASFVDLAERGLFVYDWIDAHRSSRDATCMYEPVAVPAMPLRSDQLPNDLHILADELRLSAVRFGRETSVDIGSLLTCVDAG